MAELRHFLESFFRKFTTPLCECGQVWQVHALGAQPEQEFITEGYSGEVRGSLRSRKIPKRLLHQICIRQENCCSNRQVRQHGVQPHDIV
ncbi:hypothetical protein SDC9_207945 [bioreactor metagenome]|uniref:Uncharacterized protein n=1 Tax=bioreactor metagenome TaxID=1076179 RepID=A0A645JAN2_9ZZZZ